jgi:hypothetical protein
VAFARYRLFEQQFLAFFAYKQVAHSTRAIRFVGLAIYGVLRCFRWNHSAGKLQIPSSKLQRSSKVQTSTRRPGLVLRCAPYSTENSEGPFLRLAVLLPLYFWRISAAINASSCRLACSLEMAKRK